MYSLSDFWAVTKHHKTLFLVSFASTWFSVSLAITPTDIGKLFAFSLISSFMIVKAVDLKKNYSSLNTGDQLKEVLNIAVGSFITIVVFCAFTMSSSQNHFNPQVCKIFRTVFSLSETISIIWNTSTAIPK
jgi:hypothetical protein